MQARFVSGSDIYNLDTTTGWRVSASSWMPAGAGIEAQIASGMPSADYAGGELMAEVLRDVKMTLPLRYEGVAPAGAQRALEAFLRRGVALKNLEFQVRDDMAFDAEPLWGQWGAWRRYVVIGLRPLQPEQTFGVGVRKGWLYANLDLICQPAILGQPQLAARAKGQITPDVEADGLIRGVTVEDDDASFLAIPAAAVSATAGTITIVWEAGPALLPAENHPIFYMASGLGLWWNNALDGMEWEVTDGTDTAKTTAESYPAVGVTVVFHVTWKARGFKLYKNGALVASEADYTAFTPADIYIGTNDAPDYGIRGVFKFVSTYGTAMTAAQIATDYADIAAAMTAGPSPSPVPYLLTVAGDGIIGNTLDTTGSTGAPHQNYAIIGGVAGTMPARYALNAKTSANLSSIGALFLSTVAFGENETIDGLLFNDDGNSTASSSSAGGGYTSVPSTPGGVYFDISLASYKKLAGRTAYGLFRAAGLSAAGSIELRLVIGGRTIASGAVPFNASAGFRLERTRGLVLPPVDDLFTDAGLSGTVRIYFYISRSTGAGGYNADWTMLLLDPVRITSDIAQKGIIYDGVTAAIYNTTGNAWNGNAILAGNALRIVPNRINYLFAAQGDNTTDPLIAWTLTVNSLTLTPRWSVV